jgi:AraC-like DNA-binding protein
MGTIQYVSGVPQQGAAGAWWQVRQAAHIVCGPGWSCNRRSHPGHQIMFMIAGRGHGTYCDQPWKAHAGQAVLMDLGRPHSYYSDAESPWEMYWVTMQGDGVAPVFEMLLKTSGSCVAPFASKPRLEADFASIFDLLTTQKLGYPFWAWCRLTSLIANVAEGISRERGFSAGAERVEGIPAAIELIRRRFAQALTLDELADAAQLSRFHFLREFRKATGSTPFRYLTRYRVQQAQNLMMLQPALQLKAVAGRVGFSDAAHFSRIFRQQTGMNPRLYRSQQPRSSSA